MISAVFNSTFRRIALWLIPFLFVLLPAIGEAQSGGFAGSYTRMGFGPRGMASGNALSASEQQGIYSHYNPALAASAQGHQIDFTSAVMAFDRTLHGVNATFPLPPQAGLSVGLLNANVSDIDGRTSSGYDTGELSTHEFQLFVSFGINLGERARIGTSVKLHRASFHERIEAATGAGFDVGLIVEPVSDFKASIAVQDLLAGYSWNTDDLYGSQSGTARGDEFPTRFKFGLTYEPSEDLFVASEYEFLRVESEIFERTLSTDGPARSDRRTADRVTAEQLLRFGGGYRIHEYVSARAGMAFGNLDDFEQSFKPSAGFSLHLPYDQYQPTIDYAWVREPTGISHMHVVALQINL